MFVKWILTSFGTKHILHIHGGVFSRITLSKYKLWFLFLKYYFRTFDHIFCLTKEQYRMAAKCLGSTRALQLVPNYVEIPDVNRLDKSDQNLNLLYIGRLHPDKGILDSVRAVQQLTGNNIRFWIIGSGELERHLAALRDPRINFLGKKFGEDKNSFLSKAHVFLQPTSWPEGMPYSLLEAAAHGLALISTPVGAIDQILLHGKNGYFVEKGNIEMIRHVLQIFEANRELVVQMGKTSRKICEQRFSVDRLQVQYDQLLPKLCARVVNPQKQPFHLPKRTS
jgi:glycosyltransferase involved in cell wall biosynthesis